MASVLLEDNYKLIKMLEDDNFWKVVSYLDGLNRVRKDAPAQTNCMIYSGGTEESMMPEDDRAIASGRIVVNPNLRVVGLSESLKLNPAVKQKLDELLAA